MKDAKRRAPRSKMRVGGFDFLAGESKEIGFASLSEILGQVINWQSFARGRSWIGRPSLGAGHGLAVLRSPV
jgi:hypothetical protein